MAIDIVFQKVAYAGGPIALVFGDDGGEAPARPSSIGGSAPLVVRTRFSGFGTIDYDNRNPRRASTAQVVTHQVAGRALPHVGSGWGLTAPAAAESGATHGIGRAVVGEPSAAWLAAEKVGAMRDAAWALGKTRSLVQRAVHEAGLRFRAESDGAWEMGARRQAGAQSPHQVGRQGRAELREAFERADHWQALASMRFGRGRASPTELLAPWGLGRPIPPGLSVLLPGGEVVTPRELDFDLVFCRDPYTGGPVNLVFGYTCGGSGPVDPGDTIVVPVRSVYMTINSLSLVRVSDGAVVPAAGFSMGLDTDSWTWSWSATVQGRAMSLFAPELGDPVELAATINGVEFRFLAEEVGRTRRYGESALAVSGRGLSAALDAPYAQSMNFASAAARTAQQLAIEALTLNGEGIGWSVEWGLEDWLVPGGVWSHQGSHISAINAIAAAAGGYVQPHRTAKTLRVLPRYPMAPWDWAGVTPDIVLPSDPVIVEGIKWSSKPNYNRVHVSGQASGGLGEVTRGGTAGNVSAPMVVDQLITAAAAARQRGLSVLADTGRQALVTLSMPVLAETGLILPGQFLQYVDGSEARRGIVRSSSLTWEQPRMRQQITVETHEIE